MTTTQAPPTDEVRAFLLEQIRREIKPLTTAELAAIAVEAGVLHSTRTAERRIKALEDDGAITAVKSGGRRVWISAATTPAEPKTTPAPREQAVPQHELEYAIGCVERKFPTRLRGAGQPVLLLDAEATARIGLSFPTHSPILAAINGELSELQRRGFDVELADPDNLTTDQLGQLFRQAHLPQIGGMRAPDERYTVALTPLGGRYVMAEAVFPPASPLRSALAKLGVLLAEAGS